MSCCKPIKGEGLSERMEREKESICAISTTWLHLTLSPFLSLSLYIYNHKKTLISRATLPSFSRTIFLNELKNIKQTLINNGFPSYIVVTEIKPFNNKPEQPNIEQILNHKKSINLYYKKQFHCNYKIDEHILKYLIQKSVLPTNPTKKVRLIIYYNKFKTSNQIISNNTSPFTELLERTNVVYVFKCPLEDCVS